MRMLDANPIRNSQHAIRPARTAFAHINYRRTCRAIAICGFRIAVNVSVLVFPHGRASLVVVRSAQNTPLPATLLKNVSRSFYLTLRVLPADLQTPIGLAYLLARAADTIADTAIVPPAERLELLLDFRAQVCRPGQVDADFGLRMADWLRAGCSIENPKSKIENSKADQHERELLQALPAVLDLLQSLGEADRAEVRSVVVTLTEGMEMDLRTFPLEGSGQLAALETHADLDRYIYLVAGCVGGFWTRITAAHTPALRDWNVADMSERGIRFGKALQLTNVLRDCPKDLKNGRCYFPREDLAALGLCPRDLLAPAESGADARARPLLNRLLRTALEHYREARRYTLAIPPQCGRLRLACLWPILIGLPTLENLAATDAWLDPRRAGRKISRWQVYRTLALSLPAVGSDTLVDLWIERLLGRVERRLTAVSGF